MRKTRLRKLKIEPGEDVIIPKSKIVLGTGVKETDLGYIEEGEIAQYRGPNNLHIHEFEEHYRIHKDNYNPEEEPIGHTVIDAPEIPIGFGIGGLAAKVSYDHFYDEEADNKAEALIISGLIGIVSGLLAYGVTRAVRESTRATKRIN